MNGKDNGTGAAVAAPDSGRSLGDAIAEHAGTLISKAVQHPEAALVVAVGLVAYKRNPGFRAFVTRLLGGAVTGGN